MSIGLHKGIQKRNLRNIMESQIKNQATNSELVDNNFKRNCRLTAIETAHRINPAQLSGNWAQTGITEKQPASVDKILTDAEKIYTWLTKHV